MALPLSALSPADQARLARKVGVTLPDGRVYRNGVIVSAQDSANSAATRARDAAFAAQTGQYAVRDGVNPNQAGQQAFDAYMGITRPNTKQNGPVGFQAVQSAPIIERPSTMGASWNTPRTVAAQAAPAATPSPTVAPAPALGSAWYDSEEFNTAVSTPGFDNQLAAYERAYSEAADRGDTAAKRGFASAAETTRRMRDAQGFMQGGYTGPGAPSKPAGIVHAGEFVIPADKVKEIGVRKLDAYFGTDSSKPKTEYQEGGYVAELMAYQSLFPNRNYSQENLARIANMPGGEQILMAQVLEARRAVAERQQQEQTARADTVDSRREQARIAREEREQAARLTRDARQAEFLRARQPELADEVQKFQDRFIEKQLALGETLAGITRDTYDKGVGAKAPWVMVANELGESRPMTLEEFAGSAQRRGTPASAAVADALQRIPEAVKNQTEVAAAKRDFDAASLRLNANMREYETVRSADPILQAPEPTAPAAEAAPVVAEQFFLAGDTERTRPVSREVAERAQYAADIQAAGDRAMALGTNVGGTATNVTTPTGALPQGSVGFQAADGTYRVLLPGQEWKDAQSFPSEAAAAAYFRSEAAALASERGLVSQLSPAAQTAYLTGGDLVGAPAMPSAPAPVTSPVAPALSGAAWTASMTDGDFVEAPAMPSAAPADPGYTLRPLPAGGFVRVPNNPSPSIWEYPAAAMQFSQEQRAQRQTESQRARFVELGLNPDTATQAQVVAATQNYLLSQDEERRRAAEARRAGVTPSTEAALNRSVRRAGAMATPLPATAYWSGPQA